EKMKIGAVRDEDARGRHTTTYRRMWCLPSGVLLIDTPGIRELQNWGLESTDSFEDITELARNCRFTNCGHDSEPGCAVRVALEGDELDRERFENWKKLGREADFQSRKRDKGAQSRLKGEVRKVHRDLRRYQKAKRGDPEGES